MSPFSKRFAVIVNPRGGTRQGLAVLEQVRPVFARAGAELDVHVSEHPGHAARIAQSLDLAKCDGLCLVGGDGTVHEAVAGLMQRGDPVLPPLGLIPAGTGNTLHREVQCTNPLEAAQRVLAGRTRPLDAARLTMRDQVVWCVDIIGWGAVSDINRTAEKLRWLGSPRYALAALWYIARPRRRRARLVLDGRTFDDEFLFVIGCNVKSTGSGMIVAPRAEIGDGKIDVVVLRNTTRAQMLKVFKRVFDGSHVSLPCIGYHQVRSFSIEYEGPEPLDLDGELKGSAPLSVEMAPGALQVFA
jgi:YegS/Rv2252/BmrU family lipid kinase